MRIQSFVTQERLKQFADRNVVVDDEDDRHLLSHDHPPRRAIAGIN